MFKGKSKKVNVTNRGLLMINLFGNLQVENIYLQDEKVRTKISLLLALALMKNYNQSSNDLFDVIFQAISSCTENQRFEAIHTLSRKYKNSIPITKIGKIMINKEFYIFDIDHPTRVNPETHKVQFAGTLLTKDNLILKVVCDIEMRLISGNKLKIFEYEKQGLTLYTSLFSKRKKSLQQLWKEVQHSTFSLTNLIELIEGCTKTEMTNSLRRIKYSDNSIVPTAPMEEEDPSPKKGLISRILEHTLD